LHDLSLSSSLSVVAALGSARLSWERRDKLAVVLDAVEKMKARRLVQSTVHTPVLEPYVA
jgi:hypothetical protein